MYQSQIIVTNHSLLLSDIELGSGVVLPNAKDVIYVLDECHHLPSKALDHFAKSAPIKQSIDWINSLTQVMTKAIQADLITESQKQNMHDRTHHLVQCLTRIHDLIKVNQHCFSESIWLVKTIPDAFRDAGRTILTFCRNIIVSCEHIQARIEDKTKSEGLCDEDKANAVRLLGTFGFILNRVENLHDTWELFCHESEEKEAPIAAWFMAHNEDFVCHASPIHVADKLKQKFWDLADNGVVLCSATIRALGRFDDFIRRVGLKHNSRCVKKCIDTHFDYNRSVLYLPRMMHEPRGLQQDSHCQEAMTLLPELILPKGGTLVLFTSRQAMETTYQAMSDELIPDILMQSHQSKQKLIQLHKRRIEMHKRSILFGLASFGEGLDLPADYCQHVIIHKIPFSVPTTPVEVTRKEWLQKNKLNAFILSTLPAASIRLTQYAGRLVRQECDYGVVTILDKRLYTKSYGRQLLDHLQPFFQWINKDIESLKSLDKIKMLYHAS